MTILLSDREISQLINEKKVLPANFSRLFTPRSKRGHREVNLDVTGSEGSRFRLVFRQSLYNSLDFSVILLYIPEGTNQHFRIRRYNGKSHEHTNQIEKNKFYDYHIHTASERYQGLGFKEDDFAEPTSRYSDQHGALDCMLDDCAFEIEGEQLTLRDL